MLYQNLELKSLVYMSLNLQIIFSWQGLFGIIKVM